MDAEQLSKLRRVADESTLKNRWLHQLTDEQLEEIYNDLRLGLTMIEIVDEVQQEWRILFDLDPRDLMPDLANFKIKALDDLALLEAQERNNEPGAAAIKQKLQSLSTKIDALGRMGWLADVQTDRVLMFINMEKDEGKPMLVLNDTIRQLGSLLEKYIKLENEVGAARITITASAPNEFSFETADDTQRIVQATRKLLALTEDRSIVVDDRNTIDVELPQTANFTQVKALTHE